MNLLQPILITLLLSVILQLLLWRHALHVRNAGWVDLGWTLGMALGANVLLFFHNGPRALLVIAVVMIWAFRLAAHIYLDRLHGGKPEDGRYTALREHWGKYAKRNFFFFFQGQALLSAFFLLPPLVTLSRTAPFPDLQDFAGVAIALGAIACERLADVQLARFRADPVNKGKVCQRGFWKYSRHPNYFFEFLHWTAYTVWALGAPGYSFTLLGALMMYIFLRYLTGIPHTERQSLKSRGDAYRLYQQTTSPFFPWIPRKPS